MKSISAIVSIYKPAKYLSDKWQGNPNCAECVHGSDMENANSQICIDPRLRPSKHGIFEQRSISRIGLRASKDCGWVIWSTPSDAAAGELDETLSTTFNSEHSWKTPVNQLRGWPNLATIWKEEFNRVGLMHETHNYMRRKLRTLMTRTQMMVVNQWH
jgi:hypothetical protein